MKKHFTILIILFGLTNFALFGQDSNAKSRIIKVDYNKSAGDMNTMFKECIGAGRANEGLRADWQQQLTMVKKECDFKYIRMHGLLTDDMAVYREDNKGNPEYNYQYIDALYDFLLSIKMKPFVELGFMPSALASGNETIFWWRGNVTPPKDYKKWEDLIRNLTQHFTERYGVEEVKTWYFEVWNEPNLSPGFWTGTQEEYFKLYDYTARAIKSVNPAYKVGGPATAGAAWVPETIEFATKNNVPLDFISTHAYGVGQGFLDEYGESGTVLSNDASSVSGEVINSRKQISSSAKPNLELHYTEWSSSYTPADPIHDSYHSAAYILQKLKQVGNAANSMSYWVFTDIFEEPGPRFTPFHGGFGLLNTQGIKKPAYFSYSFLNKLGETELQNSDTSSWATKNAKGDVQLLFWDFTYTLPDATNNQQYYIKDLPSKPKGSVKIEVAGLQKGKYILEIYKVGYKVNDVFTDYLGMNKPNRLTLQQVNTLKQKNNGDPISTETVKIDSKGIYSKDFKINENDVLLLNFIKQ
ncbi:GH39 family glycosyl hydrolase [Flavobacterium sp. N3904]|uniref:GH39 family glycosyl hydrolase n=1 Tax=Flavobacterium sp. N3904 TaxID=2986835 RepID=UPI0022248D64|nr:glycoside hydrolase [Flavobacterium sp. N3904]